MKVEVLDMTVELKGLLREARTIDAHLKYEESKLFKNKNRIIRLTIIRQDFYDKFWKKAYIAFPAIKTATTAQVQSGSIRIETAE